MNKYARHLAAELNPGTPQSQAHVAEALDKFSAGGLTAEDFLAALTDLGDVVILVCEAHVLYVYYVYTHTYA